MTIKTCLLIKNNNYTHPTEITDASPVGLIVHSTGCEGVNDLKRCVQPVQEQEYYNTVINDIGKNTEGSDWNRPKPDGVNKCVHFFMGLNKKGNVETYQTLPLNICAWGVGKGSKGSYNYNPNAHLQIEIMEGKYTDSAYFDKVKEQLIELCVYLCKTYSWKPEKIISHKEAHDRGYGSDHNDADFYFSRFGYSMNQLREDVATVLNPPKTYYRVIAGSYYVKVNAERVKKELINDGYSAFIESVTKK